MQRIQLASCSTASPQSCPIKLIFSAFVYTFIHIYKLANQSSGKIDRTIVCYYPIIILAVLSTHTATQLFPKKVSIITMIIEFFNLKIIPMLRYCFIKSDISLSIYWLADIINQYSLQSSNWYSTYLNFTHVSRCYESMKIFTSASPTIL